MNELISAIFSVQDRKALGRDDNLSKVWKHRGIKMAHCLYKVIRKVWTAQSIPQDWKNASIVPLLKK